MVILDREGNERSEAWLRANFGDVRVNYPQGNVDYDILAVVEGGPTVASEHTVLDENGDPLAGVPVVLGWIGGPQLPAGSGWYERGAVGPTDARGIVGQVLNEYYELPGHGPYDAWVQGVGASPMFEGLGMVWNTEHCHLDIVWQKVNGEPDPPPDPEPPPDPDPDPPPDPGDPDPGQPEWEQLFQMLRKIIGLLEVLASE